MFYHYIIIFMIFLKLKSYCWIFSTGRLGGLAGVHGAYRSISAYISLSRLASSNPDLQQPRRCRWGRRRRSGLLLAVIVVIVSWGCGTENAILKSTLQSHRRGPIKVQEQ